MNKKFDGLSVVVDSDGVVKDFEDIEIQTMFSKTTYTAAFNKYASTGDCVSFAHSILSNCVISPSEFKKVKFFTHDGDALLEVCTAIIELHQKESEINEKKKKHSSLRASKEENN